MYVAMWRQGTSDGKPPKRSDIVMRDVPLFVCSFKGKLRGGAPLFGHPILRRRQEGVERLRFFWRNVKAPSWVHGLLLPWAHTNPFTTHPSVAKLQGYEPFHDWGFVRLSRPEMVPVAQKDVPLDDTSQSERGPYPWRRLPEGVVRSVPRYLRGNVQVLQKWQVDRFAFCSFPSLPPKCLPLRQGL